MDQVQRYTQQRQQIMRLVKFSTEPVTAATVAKKVRAQGLRLSTATIYRNLELLVRTGAISAVPSDDRVKHYVGSEWHDATFTCQRCGKRRHLTSRTLPRYVDRKMFGDQMIFTSSLRATGLCASCAKKTGRRT